MTEQVSGFYTDRESISIYLNGQTINGRRLISRIIMVMQVEITDLMASGEWDAVAQVAQTAAEMVKYSQLCQTAQEDAEDENV